MRILKFGGTSMGDAQTWRQVFDIINKYDDPFVVVSATAHTTRKLLKAAEFALNDLAKAIAIAEKIQQRHTNLVNDFLDDFPNQKDAIFRHCLTWINSLINELKSHLSEINQEQELSDMRKDTIASIGEQLSSYLFVQCGTAAGFSTKWIDATEIIRTNSEFGQASPDTEFIEYQSDRLTQLVKNGAIPVMGGYYGSNKYEQTTTLGLEGSDYSASLIGAALNADAIEIWTDVSGLYTCDPRIIPGAKPIPELSFQEAAELAYFGAKVLHPSTTQPASKKNIPVWVKNIFEADNPGTCISDKTTNDERVKAITYKENCTIITVSSSQTVMGYEFLASVFDILRWHHLAVDVVTTTEASISIGITNNPRIDDAVKQLTKYGSVKATKNQGIISLVGCKNDKFLIRDILAEVKDTPVNLISYSKSKGNLNMVITKEKVLPSVKAIHYKLFN